MEKNKYNIFNKFTLTQPQQTVVDDVYNNFKKGNNIQTLLGITGSGKTFVYANIINKLNKNTLIIINNKSLIEQTCDELREIFPNNDVCKFTSWYDVYTPECYLPKKDELTSKRVQINAELKEERIHTLTCLDKNEPTIVVASVSCIFGAGWESIFDKVKISPLKLREGFDKIYEDLDKQLSEIDEQFHGRLVERINKDVFRLKKYLFEGGEAFTGMHSYAIYFDDRDLGSPIKTIIDMMGDDFLTIIDECHRTIPQLRSMYPADKKRKMSMIKSGWYLPCILENRPLKIEEFWEKMQEVLFVSATPNEFEIINSQNVAKLELRPTGILDPEIIIKEKQSIFDEHNLENIKQNINAGNQILINAYTKSQAELLSEKLNRIGINSKYIHCGIKKKADKDIIFKDFKDKKYDILIGIKLLQEGLSFPNVNLVIILNACGCFNRGANSLLQMIGRAARNKRGKVELYCEGRTTNINSVYNITKNRRELQSEYNTLHNIESKTIII